MSVRVRYAPSPTGSPHVGNLRTALYCHLFAKRHGGVMMVRIEDTDRARLVPGCEDEILESLHWMGIQWQEGPDIGGPNAPYRQSERKDAGLYEPHIRQLLESGKAYKAFDTPEELEAMREEQKANKQDFGYFGGVWRDASAAMVGKAEAEGRLMVIRLAMPRDRVLRCNDGIRGVIEWEPGTSDDPVLIKADGMPTYHFAAMVDDHLMGTTHIFRGDEWISSAPKHVWLFEALGWEPPMFVHVPVILGTDGKKLSKRHGDTRVLDFRSAGYLPEALANFVALIGWAPGNNLELMTMEEMGEAFDIAGLHSSPGVFDLEKLNWMNGHYVRGLTIDELVSRTREFVTNQETDDYWLRPDFASAGTSAHLNLLELALTTNPDYVRGALELEQKRVVTLADFGEATAFFFEEDPPMDAKAVEKWFHEAHVRAMFTFFIEQLGGGGGHPPHVPHPEVVAAQPSRAEAISVEECEKLIRGYASENGFEKLGPVVHPTRVALTGKTAGPGLFELMSVLGPTRMVKRFNRALGLLPA